MERNPQSLYQRYGKGHAVAGMVLASIIYAVATLPIALLAAYAIKMMPREFGMLCLAVGFSLGAGVSKFCKLLWKQRRHPEAAQAVDGGSTSE